MTSAILYNISVVDFPTSAIGIEFHALDAQHTITLITIFVLCLLVAKTARGGESYRVKWLRWIIGIFLLGYAVFFYTHEGIDNALSLEYSLPLGLCDIVLVACLISLIRPTQLATEIAYFFGFGGVLQATVTPDLLYGFPSLEFILFFWSHGAALCAIIFLISSYDFRPRKGSVVRMMLVLNIYGGAVGTIDAFLGWNYGYICRKPSMPSLLDYMGPWPWYLLSIELIALLTFLLLNLPWQLTKNK